jgi:hypothetical protein
VPGAQLDRHSSSMTAGSMWWAAAFPQCSAPASSCPRQVACAKIGPSRRDRTTCPPGRRAGGTRMKGRQ